MASEILPRFLGYIFASADLVFEIDDTGRVHSVIGAASLLTGRDPGVLEGQPWSQLFAPPDHDLIQHLIGAMHPGERKGPVRVKLIKAGGGDSDSPFMGLSLFQSGQGKPVSASLSQSSTPDLPRAPRASNGLLSLAEMEADMSPLLAQIQAEGGKVQVEMLELSGLTLGAATLDPFARQRLEQRFSASLRAASVRGGSAVDLGDERFVILADQASRSGDLAKTLEALGAEFGLTLSANQHSVPLSGELTAEQSVRALKVALDVFAREGALGAARSLTHIIATTSSHSRKICEIVAEERFELLFQPIIDLVRGGVHHYEALARLGGADESPAEAMRLAEELAIVDTFDHAVAAEAIRTLRDSPDSSVRIAINVSPFTFMKPRYVPWVCDRLRNEGVSPSRLLVELTESVPIEDFDTARAHIERLRAAGVRFCLDDVGSGAASLDYLRHLPFDYAKLDGRFAHDLARDKRSQILVQNMVVMCNALGGAVIAEQIETEEVSALLKAADVAFGQGWLFGRAAPLPAYIPSPIPYKAMRRQGAAESWG
jgi:EAL domain-containing protein (putative c-di-GMP-specific phosphodiesterase class I)